MDSISGPNNRFSWVYSQVQKGDYLPVQKKYDWPYDQLPAPSKIPGAALEFPLGKLGEPSDVHLYLNNALCEARWDNGITLKTFVHATEFCPCYGTGGLVYLREPAGNYSAQSDSSAIQ